MTFALETKVSRPSSAHNSTEQSGWDDELLTLYEHHYSSLCGTAKRVVGSVAAAEDIVQDAFLRYQINTLRPTPGKELAYLRSIVMNSARSYLRRREVARRYVEAFRQPHVGGANEWIGRVGLEILLRAISSLPTRQREVVVFRIIMDRSEKETATALAISPGAVKAHFARARQALRLRVEPWALSSVT